MDLFDEELLAIFKAFHESGLKYMVVGGFATNFYGYSRATGDIDIWIEDSLTNRKALRKSFSDIQYGDFEAFETIPFLPGWTTLTLNSGFSFDIMSEMKGFGKESFDSCFELANRQMIHAIPVHFLHYNHLIQAKKATHRDKDLLDIEELEKIKKEEKKDK